ncbi:MAG: PAS domain S-box protein, partial [bacterium]
MQKHQEDSKRAPVLIIDDEPAHLKTIADILATEQLQPICCRNAKEALQVCKQQRVNVAILDLRLPDMDGLKLLKRLKQQNPDIKVIIHTGYASLESAVAAINEEAYAYVRKIGDVEELLAQVHRAFHAHLTLHSEKLEQAVQKRTAELSRANQKLKKEITQRKQAVDAQRMTQFAVDNAADFIYRIDADARIRYVNNAVCQALGFSRDELLSMSIPDIDPNYSFERWLDSWRELKQHNSISSESIHRRKDGSTFPVEISISYHQINGVEYSYAFVRDITERKRTEEALRQSEEKYRLVVENANEAIIVVQDGKMQFVNPKTLEITGYSEKELTTKPFIEFIYQDDRAMVAERHQKRLKGEQIPPVYSFRIIDKEGNLKWLEINAVLIEWEGKPGTLNFLNDISERKRTEEALRQSEEKYRT